MFERVGTSWKQAAKLVAPDGRPYHGFGGDVAVGSGFLAIGASSATGQVFKTGAAYLYRPRQDGWALIAKVGSLDGATHDFFGQALDVLGEEIVLGAAGDDDAGNHTGSAYLFEMPADVDPYGFCSGGPCGNVDPVAGCSNSTARGGRLAACESASIAADDLVLTATELPPNVPTVVFRGGSRTAVPFADGVRLVTAGPLGLFRFAPVQSAADGSLQQGPGIVAFSQLQGPGAIVVGQTWFFQGWYRDAAGPCGGGSNFTNGLGVTFSP